MRAVIGWKNVLYQSTKHRAELKLSRRMPNCIMFDLFRDFSLVFFPWLKETFRNKQASK